MQTCECFSTKALDPIPGLVLIAIYLAIRLIKVNLDY